MPRPTSHRSALSGPTPALLCCLLAACAGTPPTARTTAPAEASTTGPAPQQPRGGWRSPLSQAHPLVGRIVHVASGRRLTQHQLLGELTRADVVILGEQHDNPDHHLLQAALIRGMDDGAGVDSVVFEQVRLGQQAALDAYLASATGTLDGLADALRWERSGWPAWTLYAPVFEASIAAGAGLRAGSLDPDTTMAIARDGADALPAALRADYGLSTPLHPARQAALRQAMRDAHCGMLPAHMLDAMVLVQRARDANLAGAVRAARAAGPAPAGGSAGITSPSTAILIAGNGHARTDRGVPSYLTATPTLRVRSLGLLEVRPGQVSPADYAAGLGADPLPFDYVWFTPVASDTDHCAALRARFGGSHPK